MSPESSRMTAASGPTVSTVPLEQVRRPDEVGDEGGRRAVVQVFRRPDLLDPAPMHHRDPVAHRERLLLIVGHVHEGDADVDLDALELDLEALAELEVEGAERLVEEQHVGLVDQRPRERDALLLPAGQLVGAALLVAGQVDLLEDLPGAAPDLVLGHASPLQPEPDVAGDIEVGEQGIALEDHVHRPLVRWLPAHVVPAELDGPAGRQVEAADHPERRRLAATRRAEEREELAGADRERDVVDRPDLAEHLREAVQSDLGRGCTRHDGRSVPEPARRSRRILDACRSRRRPGWSLRSMARHRRARAASARPRPPSSATGSATRACSTAP